MKPNTGNGEQRTAFGNQRSAKNKLLQSRLISLHLLVFFIGATLFLLLSPQQVSSLGVAPSLFNLDNPENVIELRLRILNSQQEDLFVTIKPQGTLADYVELEKTTYRLTPKETEKTIYYKVSIPNNLPPGQNVLNMYVMQLDEYTDGNDVKTAQLNAKVSVVQRVNVNIPYPGEYLTGNLFVNSNKVTEPVDFMVHLINKGEQEVTANGKITVRGSTNQIIATVPIPETKVSASSDKKITISMHDIENSGEYYAEAQLQYSSKQLVLRKTFTVGNELVTAYNLAIERFKLGEIVKVLIDVNSEWNKVIEDLTAKVKVINPTSGNVVSTFESNTIDIPANGITKLEAYWDTKDMLTGEYDIDVQLYYSDQVTQNFFDTMISLEGIEISKQLVTGQAISSTKESDKTSGGLTQTVNLLVFLVIILIIIVVALVVIVNKKLRGKR